MRTQSTTSLKGLHKKTFVASFYSFVNEYIKWQFQTILNGAHPRQLKRMILKKSKCFHTKSENINKKKKKMNDMYS